jgi:hypothetical protein
MSTAARSGAASAFSCKAAMETIIFRWLPCVFDPRRQLFRPGPEQRVSLLACPASLSWQRRQDTLARIWLAARAMGVEIFVLSIDHSGISDFTIAISPYLSGIQLTRMLLQRILTGTNNRAAGAIALIRSRSSSRMMNKPLRTPLLSCLTGPALKPGPSTAENAEGAEDAREERERDRQSLVIAGAPGLLPPRRYPDVDEITRLYMQFWSYQLSAHGGATR